MSFGYSLKGKVVQLCLTHCDSMACRVHGILKATEMDSLSLL